MRTTRRGFLRTSCGLVLCFRVPQPVVAATAFDPNRYIQVVPDNSVRLWISRSEMGQGVRTALAAVLAEELEVDLAAVQLVQAIPGGRFQGIRLRTSGSGSASGTFAGLRKAGATAREMLLSAAAETWGIDRATCRANLGAIHDASGRSLTYGELAAAAARQTPPPDPPLKKTSEFRLIGKPVNRVDGPDIVRGRATYGLDARVPEMLVAVIEHCPYIGGEVASFDAAPALAIPGVRHVTPVRTGIYRGIAVVADHTWLAEKGRQALKVQWTAGPHAGFDSDRFIDSLRSASAADSYPVRREGAIGAGKRLEAVYEYPFQAHAPLEPMNTVADARAASCEIWAPSQTPETARDHAAKALQLPVEAVTVHTTLMGGGFGRRLFVDYADEAVEISKAVGRPVQVVWNRADDMRAGFFHPASVERMAATLAEGTLQGWEHVSVGSDLSMFGLPTPEEKQDRQRYAKDESPWGAFDTPYKFGGLKVDYVPVDSPVPSGSWRAVEYPSRVFARESFLDEAAHALGQDPIELRLRLLEPGDVIVLGEQRLDRGRMMRVLQEARERAEWNRPLQIPGTAGRLAGRGIAIGIYHAGSYIAQVAEVSAAPDLSEFRVHRVVCVLDCGIAINPLGIEGQVESGIAWGLSAALHGKIDFRQGRVVQQGYHDFRVMQMGEMPVVETHILPSEAPPGGFGEHAVPPVAPAVANALFAATGKRLRKLPLTLRL